MAVRNYRAQHQVLVTVAFDKPVTAAEAVEAGRVHLVGQEIYSGLDAGGVSARWGKLRIKAVQPAVRSRVRVR